MMDKDSQLIFESYKKRVLVNEVAGALAAPAVEGLGSVLSWLAGTAVGAVIVDQAMKMLEKIPEFKRKEIESKINETNRILSLNPEEIRSSYEIINAIKNNGNKTLSEISDKFKIPIDIFRSAQDNQSVTIETYQSVLVSSIQANDALDNYYESIERDIDNIISKSDLADVEKARIQAQLERDKMAHKERLKELRIRELELKKGGGGGDDKDPKKKKGAGLITGLAGGVNLIGLILKVLAENYKALKAIFWASIILVPSFGIYLIKLLFGSGKEYGEAASQFADTFKKASDSPPTPQPKGQRPSSKMRTEEPSTAKPTATPQDPSQIPTGESRFARKNLGKQ